MHDPAGILAGLIDEHDRCRADGDQYKQPGGQQKDLPESALAGCVSGQDELATILAGISTYPPGNREFPVPDKRRSYDLVPSAFDYFREDYFDVPARYCSSQWM